MIHTPHQVIHTPHQVIYTPNQVIHTPHQVIHTPHQMIHTPHQVIHTPHQVIHTPHYVTHQVIHNPHQVRHTPRQVTHTPLQVIHTPRYVIHQIIHTPHQVIFTLHQVIHTLHQVARQGPQRKSTEKSRTGITLPSDRESGPGLAILFYSIQFCSVLFYSRLCPSTAGSSPQPLSFNILSSAILAHTVPCCPTLSTLQRCFGLPTDLIPFICHSVLLSIPEERSLEAQSGR